MINDETSNQPRHIVINRVIVWLEIWDQELPEYPGWLNNGFALEEKEYNKP